VTEEEDFGGGGRSFKLGGLVGEDFAREAVFAGTSKVLALCCFGGWGDRVKTDWPGEAGSEESGRKVTLYLEANGLEAARRMATSCPASVAMMEA